MCKYAKDNYTKARLTKKLILRCKFTNGQYFLCKFVRDDNTFCANFPRTLVTQRRKLAYAHVASQTPTQTIDLVFKNVMSSLWIPQFLSGSFPSLVHQYIMSFCTTNTSFEVRKGIEIV